MRKRVSVAIQISTPRGEKDLWELSDRLRAEVAAASRVEFQPGARGALGFKWKLHPRLKRPNIALIWLILKDALSGLFEADRILNCEYVECDLAELVLTLEVDL